MNVTHQPSHAEALTVLFEDLSFYLDCKQAKDENDFLDDNEADAFIERLAH